MGIEPTDHMISMRPDSFEDYGLHQQYKHFRIKWIPGWSEMMNPESANGYETDWRQKNATRLSD